MACSLIWRMEYARAEGKAKPLAQEMRSGEFAIAALTAVLSAAGSVALGWLPLAALGAGLAGMLLATFWLARKLQQRLGGYTGDCLGAVQQLTEAVFYLGALACTWN